MDARDIGDLYRTLQYAAERLGRQDKEKDEDLFKCTFIIEWLMDMADRDQAEGKRMRVDMERPRFVRVKVDQIREERAV